MDLVRKVRNVSTSAPEFLIRWLSYTPDYDTWEPLKHLDDDPFTYTWENPAEKKSARAHSHKWIRINPR